MPHSERPKDALRPCVVVTGGSGRLGRLVLAALGDEPALAGCPVLSTHHREATGAGAGSERSVSLSLADAGALATELPRGRPMLVLHFACSMSASFNTVYRLDCRGTEVLASVVDDVAGGRPVGFVFASSIAATDTRCNYGIGKAYIEEHLRRRTSPTFRPISVRIPVVERVHTSGEFDVPARLFAAALFTAIDFAGTLEALLAGRPPAYDGRVVSLSPPRVSGVA